MDFTELYKQSSQSCQFSPRTASLLSTVVQHRLVVRNAESLQISHLFHCQAPIAYSEWSPDERYVLCAGWSRKVEGYLGSGSEGGGWVQVFEVAGNVGDSTTKKDTPIAKIEEGAGGIVRAQWTKDGRHILTWSEFQVGHSLSQGQIIIILIIQLRITIWSLVDKTARYIRFPKHSDRGEPHRTDLVIMLRNILE